MEFYYSVDFRRIPPISHFRISKYFHLHLSFVSTIALFLQFYSISSLVTYEKYASLFSHKIILLSSLFIYAVATSYLTFICLLLLFQSLTFAISRTFICLLIYLYPLYFATFSYSFHYHVSAYFHLTSLDFTRSSSFLIKRYKVLQKTCLAKVYFTFLRLTAPVS